MYVKRLNDLDVRLDDQYVRMHCDNRQTIRLVSKETSDSIHADNLGRLTKMECSIIC